MNSRGDAFGWLYLSSLGEPVPTRGREGGTRLCALRRRMAVKSESILPSKQKFGQINAKCKFTMPINS